MKILELSKYDRKKLQLEMLHYRSSIKMVCVAQNKIYREKWECLLLKIGSSVKKSY